MTRGGSRLLIYTRLALCRGLSCNRSGDEVLFAYVPYYALWVTGEDSDRSERLLSWEIVMTVIVSWFGSHSCEWSEASNVKGAHNVIRGGTKPTFFSTYRKAQRWSSDAF